MDFELLLQQMRSSVTTSKRGHLLLGWRLKLWRQMKEVFADSSFRRNVLLYKTVSDALRLWGPNALILECPADWSTEYLPLPPRIASLLRSMLADQAPVAEEILKSCRTMMGFHDHLVDFFTEPNVSCVALEFEAVWWRVGGFDDDMYTERGWYARIEHDSQIETIDDLNSVGELDWAESHFWASELAAYEQTGRKKEDPEARRRFWLRWIDEWLPCVLGTTEEVKKCVA